MHSTLPLGSRQAGASTAPISWPPETGKSGPGAQLPGSVGTVLGGVYSAVWPLAPTANTRPSGNKYLRPHLVDSTTDGGYRVSRKRSSGTSGTDPLVGGNDVFLCIWNAGALYRQHRAVG